MCLLPGMLEAAPSYVSKRALTYCSVLNWLYAALFVVALLRVLAYAVWATIMDIFVCLFGYFMLKPLREKNALVFIENFAGMAFVTATNGVISIITLVDLVTGQQVLFDRLQQWQIIVGYCTHSAAILCYLLITVTVVLLINELRRCSVPIDEESSPLINSSPSQRRVHGVSDIAPTQQVHAFSRNSQPSAPILYSGGAQIPHVQHPGKKEKSEAEKFPGKGYSLK